MIYTYTIHSSETNTQMPGMYNSSKIANFSQIVDNDIDNGPMHKQGDERSFIFGSHSFHEVTMTYPMRYARLVVLIRLY